MKNKQAEKIPIVGYLAAVGIKPKKVKTGSAWYDLPMESVTKTIIKVDLKGNSWCEFNTEIGGNIINLVMKLSKTNYLGALILLQKPEFSKHLFPDTEQDIIKKYKQKKHRICREYPVVA